MWKYDMMKRISWILPALFLLLGGLGLSTPAHAAAPLENYDVTFKVKGINQGDTCMIAYYLGTKQYIKDTIIAGPGGLVRYQGAEKLDGGLYLFVMPGMVYFEFLFVEPKFSMETDKADPIMAMKIKGSPENQAFFNYLQFLNGRQKTVKELQDKKAATKDSVQIKALDAQIAALDKEVRTFRDTELSTHKDKFFAKLMRASMEPDVPPLPVGLSPEEGKRFQFNAYKKVYLDGIDWSDERLLRSPIIQNKVKEYLERLTVEHPDSIILSADHILSLAEANKEIFKFCVITITNMYAGTKKMCFDKIYVHMAGNYYVNGRAEWVDSTQMAKIKDRYYKMLYNDCERKAINLRLQDMEGKPFDVYGVNAKYTVLIFWAYDCGHCKKEIPAWYEFYKEYKKHGVEVVAVSTKEDLPKWKEFVKEKGLNDWLNGADPDNKTNFRILYDIYSTPVIYLLDEDKKIMGKRLDIANMKRVLHHELGLPEPVIKPEDEGHHE
jgi:thiol-disulfide isomerase/thioredoxin